MNGEKNEVIKRAKDQRAVRIYAKLIVGHRKLTYAKLLNTFTKINKES